MVYHLGVEDIEPEHWVAYIFELPGCFSSGKRQGEAIAAAPERIEEQLRWLESHGRYEPEPNGQLRVEVAEVFHGYDSRPDYRVNAFFEDDGRPLSESDIEAGIWLLKRQREALLALVEKVPQAKLERPAARAADRSIAEILKHVAWAEWWYFDCLDAGFKRESMPETPMAMLEKVRAHTLATLPTLANEARATEHSGERWSARKVLRRGLWHEKDHSEEIARLV